MAGYWLKPDTGECVRVATTHDEWVRDRKNADRLGLPPEVYAEIMHYPPTSIDEIRILAVKCGLVRIREHRRHVSVQFMAEPRRRGPILQAAAKALHGVGIHPDTELVIDDLSTNERTAMTLRDLEAALENGRRCLRA